MGTVSAPVTVAAPPHGVLVVTTASGDVTVTAEDRDDIVFDKGVIDKDQVTTDEEGRVSVRRGSADVEVRCPEGTDVIVGSASGDVELRGRLGCCRVTTASGDITVEDVDSIDVRTASGDVDVDRCDGRCRAHTASGDVTIGEVGQLDAGTVSSAVRVDEAAGSVRVRTVSGTIKLAVTGDGDVSVRSMSGSVTILMPPDVHPKLRLSTL